MEELTEVPEAFRSTLSCLQQTVPRWAHLASYTAAQQQQQQAPPGSPASSPASSASPTSPLSSGNNSNYASTGDLRVLCAMGGGVGENSDLALRDYFLTELANPQSDYAKHADDLLFVVIPPPLKEDANNNNSSSGDASSSSTSGGKSDETVTGKIFGFFKRTFTSSSSSEKKKPVEVMTLHSTTGGTVTTLTPPPSSSSLSSSSTSSSSQEQEEKEKKEKQEQQEEREKNNSNSGATSSSSVAHSEISSPLSVTTTTTHLCAEAPDPVAAGEQAVKGSSVTVLRRGIAPLQPVVQTALEEIQSNPNLSRNSLSNLSKESSGEQNNSNSNNNNDQSSSSSSPSSPSSVTATSGSVTNKSFSSSALNNAAVTKLGLPREPNWFATCALNLVCQWPYFLNVAVVKMLRIKDNNNSSSSSVVQSVPVAIRTVQRQVYPTLQPPRNIRRGTGRNDDNWSHETGKLEYPDVHFTVDDFDQAFGDIRLAPGHKLAVILTAGAPPATDDAAVAVFRGVVNYDNLAAQLKKQEKLAGVAMASSQQQNMASSFGSGSSSNSSSSTTSNVPPPAVVPLKAQSGRAEVAIWLSEADLALNQQLQQQQQQHQKGAGGGGGGGGGSSWLQGNEILHCALTRVSLHCSHVVSAFLQGVPWHSIHASWLPKTPANQSSKSRWMTFPKNSEQMNEWLQQDVENSKLK